MFELITQYGGLRRENYILFIGRIVTNLGSMIWPVLTLILTGKLGFSASEASLYMIITGAVGLPLGLLGGKIADRFNKKHVIVLFDSISILFYVICFFRPLDFMTIVILTVASFFQNMEGPSYDTLIADISTTETREKAYSLQYLGGNIGFVASPTIAGLLFAEHLNLSFLISGCSIALSTILIFFFVKNITPEKETSVASDYQKAVDSDISGMQILRSNKTVLIYCVAMAFFWCAYGQWSFLMPIDMAAAHGADEGALIYGTVNSANCILVVLLTPLITRLFEKFYQTKKMAIGALLVPAGYLVFRMGLGFVPIYYIAITLFTLGEMFMTISSGPYVSERMPASHRGRINGVLNIVQSVLSGIAMFFIGKLYDIKNVGPFYAWGMVFVMLFGAFALIKILAIKDKKCYPKLYAKE